MKNHNMMFSLLLGIITILSVTHSTFATEVSQDGRAILINGERKIILSGSIHYPRSTPEMWPDLIKKSKDGGLDAIETYVFWNSHEPVRRQYDFTGRNNLIRFLKTVQDAGLYAILRIGPYACAEWNYGGFPVWLHNMPGIELRTNNKVFMDEMQNFTTLIVDMVKNENLFASQGGPIILAQIENEYGNVMAPYGDAGKEYLNWCAKMAVAQNIGVPWLMCQQSDAPQPMINTCNGWYCHDFTPNNPNVPKIWTENWTGWFKAWGGKRPYRTSEDVAYAVARFFQTGGTLQNYYMYHGGTNFGRTTGGPYISTSYDYDAPLDEYGNLNQPKYGHLKQLHDVLHSMEKELTYGDILKTDLGNSVTMTSYKYQDISSCFINNDNTSVDATITLDGQNLTIPAWSVSILHDCKHELYNTAKVNTQTSLKARISNEAEQEPTSLSWSWRPELIGSYVKGDVGVGEFTSDVLLEQKSVTNDTSDYLWYMTNVNLDENDPIWSDDMSLQVNSSTHVLHAYVNGKEVGSQYAQGHYHFFFDQKVNNFKKGNNIISLLSATVGLQNYGPFFDKTQVGLMGPIKIVGKKSNNNEVVTKDLSSQTWTYATGLQGLDNHKLYSEESVNALKWKDERNMPINRKMTWYKTTFEPPLGTEPVIVDLSGMGKGEAFVNGISIGRFWQTYLAGNDGCDLKACDYRGQYDNNKCVFNCGKSVQTEYHVPRSFLRDDVNTLVLFEEFGGNPTQVSFKTVRTGGACANAYEGKTIELSCEGRYISGINFASFGNPTGSCGSFEKGLCEGANDAKTILTKACVGKESCSVDVSEKVFGAASNCGDESKRLAVEIVCQ
ncbi:beta-galactosidase 15-like [Spinacia oleracea]|uniref:Beta-galactosidase n=1 Tax=Spinacia oleracea TaxID=3562 RepID=A0A9R0JCL0_SPIOL|nr:beta-galactosidase 15-like [Spinacia oleracea]